VLCTTSWTEHSKRRYTVVQIAEEFGVTRPTIDAKGGSLNVYSFKFG
jgi:hypothetical protein